MVRYLQKQCESSGWQNCHECPDTSIVGVLIKLTDSQHSVHPPTLNSRVLEAMKSTNSAVSFTMVSEVTSALFDQISPYQSELQTPQGIKIPIVDSFQDVIPLGKSPEGRRFCCFVRESRALLLWSNSVESILPHGAELEKQLLETVGLPRAA